MGDHNHGHVLTLQIPCAVKRTIGKDGNDDLDESNTSDDGLNDSNTSDDGVDDSNTSDDDNNSDESTHNVCTSGNDSGKAGAMQVSSLQAGLF